MKRALLFTLLAAAGPLVAPETLRAQAVVTKPKPLDAERAPLREALVVLRDSLTTVDMARGRLRRDFQRASAASLVSRARVMRDACTAAGRTIPRTREVIGANRPSAPARATARTRLLEELGRLSAALGQCEKEFTAYSARDAGEQVRGYGNRDADKVREAIQRYNRVLQRYLAAYDFKIRPMPELPLAG